MFTLMIKTDNAAFAGVPGNEIARILRKIADRMELVIVDDTGAVVDYNGNTVVQWVFNEDD